MARPVVEIDGLRELRRALRRAGNDLEDLKAANAEAAGHVASSTNPPRVTGALAGSVRSSGTKTAGIVRAGRAAIPYAGPIHYGWPARGIPENPFLTHAAQATEPEWIDIYYQHLDKLLEQIEKETH